MKKKMPKIKKIKYCLKYFCYNTVEPFTSDLGIIDLVTREFFPLKSVHLYNSVLTLKYVVNYATLIVFFGSSD